MDNKRNENKMRISSIEIKSNKNIDNLFKKNFIINQMIKFELNY